MYMIIVHESSVILEQLMTFFYNRTHLLSLVVFMYLAFTRLKGESYRRLLTSLLLCLCGVFREPMNSLVS